MNDQDGHLRLEGGARLYYRILGDGPETVVIPAASWLAADFGPLIERHRCIFYDSRGRGRSDAIADLTRFTFDQEISDLEAVRQHFALQRASVIGWSYVGGVAALYAARHPEHVGRLILLCPIPPRHFEYEGRKTPEEIRARVDPAAFERLQDMRQAGIATSDPVAFCRAYRQAHTPRNMGNPAGLARMRSDPCAYPNEWPDNVSKVLKQLADSRGQHDWRQEVRGITAPTLVIHGAEDAIPLAASREWAATLPDARLLVIPGSGHFPWLEFPDDFFPAAAAFLSSKWPDGARRVPN